MRAIHLGLVLAVGTPIVMPAQEPAFEVASIRSNPGASRAMNITITIPGEVTMTGVTLHQLITGLAFNVDFRLAHVKFDFGKTSKELLDTRFDIRAKGPSADNRAMLRSLLKERFGFRYHTEVREIPVYAVVLKESKKLGPWLKRTPVNCAELLKTGGTAPACTASRERRYGIPIQRYAGTIDELLVHVVQPSLQRPVLNATGLRGNFEWEIAVGVDEAAVFSALEDQLGLKLENRKGPYEVIVIDDVRTPTPN